jgi:hypothetical protein
MREKPAAGTLIPGRKRTSHRHGSSGSLDRLHGTNRRACTAVDAFRCIDAVLVSFADGFHRALALTVAAGDAFVGYLVSHGSSVR